MRKRLIGVAAAFVLTTVASSERREFVMVAIGDSITQAYNSRSLFSSSPEVSWSTGTALNAGFESHFLMLRQLFPDWSIKAFNFSVVGARANESAQQVSDAIKKNPDYVTYMIGANDVCNWPEDHSQDLEKFQDDVAQQLYRFVDANPDVSVLLVPIPDIYRLWEASKDNSSCRWVWSIGNICAPLLGSSRSAEQRARFRERWRDANDALAAAAAEFPEHVLFPGELADYSFGAEHISGYDCFHPSVSGQKLIAELTWREWWNFASKSLSSLY